MIPYGKHSISQEDIDSVVNVLNHEFLTQGKQVPLFEESLKKFAGVQHAIAVNSGTSGLHIACLAAGVSDGDIVWTSPNSFAASANCALYCGAKVEFVDINPQTRNMCVEKLKVMLDEALLSNTLPKALIVVHFAGSSCDMKTIKQLTKEFKIVIIEDAAHALGGKDSEGNYVGACRYSDMTVCSFHPVKSITTAEGGAVLTNSTEYSLQLRLFASHGITKNSANFADHEKTQAWFYSQENLGFNYRLSDIHAALGVSQLKRVDDFVARRYELAKNYQQSLSALPIKLPILDANSAWHLYVIELTHHNRTEIFDRLRQKGIGVNVHYIPIYRHVYYEKLGFNKNNFPHCEAYYENAITLPLFPSLTADMQKEVINVLHEVLV